MSTLPIRAPHVASGFPGFARVIAALATFLDVLVEAQQQAIAAHKRYPFADW